MSAVIFDKLTFGYEGTKPIFDNFSLTLNSNAVNVIMGDSGVGKSTLLKLAMGLLKPMSGDISCGECSCVFQESRLVEQMTVSDNVELVLHSAYPDKKQRKQIVLDGLEKAGLSQYCNSFPNQLSGGQRRRVALLRAFLHPSDIMLLDEPFKGLDNSIKQTLAKEFLTWYDSVPKTVVFVTHDVDVAMTVGDYIYRLYALPVDAKLLCNLTDKDKLNRDLYDDYFNYLRKQLNIEV